ncbi:hypothetical protein GNX71_28980 [Variovorax sp. RKNM96]|uniref:hypothetical protein n=1 Tax=Variovorax sp. RKNM96 TaxID=2681552 RepID=UPI00197FD89F|nr:hypothetical protein [Variovorax sp. RKNM96]QSI33384.1 hypothetical protein GNX71_28980 [Variovorax sp. RKNM96]
MTSGNLFLRLQELLAGDPVFIGTVVAIHVDGTATVAMQGGGQLRLRNPLASALDARVFFEGSVITGPAPDLPVVEIEI